MGALDGIRILDIGTYIAGPFAATVLGEFGAEVIKVERPGEGDALRRFGTDTACGDTLVWLSEGRNKRSLTLNLASEEGLAVLRELIATADVVIENFRPGVLERWGLAYEQMRAINPGVVLLRVSAYGQTGPNSQLPGFARVAHAFGGLSFLAGEPGRTPVVPGSTSLADYISGLYGAIGILLALRAREITGVGQEIDIALYETIFRVLDEIAPAYQQHGFVRERRGADTVNVVPHSHYRTADDGWIAIACTNDEMWSRLCAAMGRPGLAAPDTYGPKQQRLAAFDEVNRLVGEWVGSMSRAEVLAVCREHEVPSGPLNSIADIFEDPQFQHRENIVLHESRIGEVAVPNVIPQMKGTPGEIRWLGPALGSDTDSILADLLHRSPEQIADLHERGVV